MDGQEEALEAFCRREHPRLVGALSLYCGDAGVAEEVAQEGLYRACRSLPPKTGQTAARWHVMSVVSTEALTVPAMARRLGLARHSVQRVINELPETGVVVARPNPDHARQTLIHLTADGQGMWR